MPSLATISNSMTKLCFSGITRGLTETVPFERPGTVADGSRGRITMTSFGTMRPCKLAKALMS